jgi:hypothetical protein
MSESVSGNVASNIDVSVGNPTIIVGQTLDPISFMVNQFSGYVLDDQSNLVAVQAAYPLRSLVQSNAEQVVVKEGQARFEWLSIGAHRLRWYMPFELQVYAYDLNQRFRIEVSVRERLAAINAILNTNPYILAQNVVFINPKIESRKPELITLFGKPIYFSAFNVELIFDTVKEEGIE